MAVVLGMGACFVYWRLLEAKKKLLKMSSVSTSKLHPDQLGTEDEPLEMHAYQCPIPPETEEYLRMSLGIERFESYRYALTRPTSKTHFRLQMSHHTLIDPISNSIFSSSYI